MGALKRYRSLGGGDDFFKFEPGMTLEGIWRGTKRGKYGENGIIETPDGILHVFTLSAMLKDLIKVPDGTGVKVTHVGMRQSKAGNTYHAFQILVEESGDGDDADVPF